MKKFLLLPILLLAVYVVSATGRVCGTMEYLDYSLQQDPGLKQKMDAIEEHTNNFVSHYRNLNGQAQAAITIPVVVHVLYNTAAQNVSDAKILAQLDVLNKDFTATNADISSVPSAFSGLVANTNVQFCLAQRDPSGNATTGIVRKSTTVTSFSSNNAVKYTAQGGSDAWPAGSYLNIWVCNLGSGLLGYAQFPGGTAATDGVVILYSSLPGGSAAPYNLGRTATHEVGHWLNLRHIWGDANCGTDLVGDTPTQQTSNFGCPSFPHVTCSNGANGDMFMNYMDYTDDGCMFMFSAGQSTRINALFSTGGTRSSLSASLGCVAPSTSCGTPSGVAASGITTSSTTVSWTAVAGATSYNVQYKLSAAGTWTNTTTSSVSIALTGLSESSAYDVQVQAVCSLGNSSFSTPVSFSTATSTPTCNAPAGLASSAITNSTASISWNAVSGAISYNLQYKVSTSSTWSTYNTASTVVNFNSLSGSTTYNTQVQTVCSAGTSSYSAIVSFTTAANPVACTDVYEANNSISAAKTFPLNTTINAMISTATDKDYFKFKVTSLAKNFKVILNNLPNDYDAKLYKGTKLIFTSASTGTTSEIFYLNGAATNATYTVYVYGYSGAYNNANCYALNISTSSTAFSRFEVGREIFDDAGIEDMIVYPNPARNILTVNAPFEATSSARFQIFDVTGKVVSQTAMGVEKDQPVTLDIAGLQSGLYILRVEQQGEMFSKKFVVNK